MSGEVVYKILTGAEWKAAQAAGVYSGSAHDLRDGFIHFSSAAQLEETARKHFRDVRDLILLSIDSDHRDVAAELRWEPSRGGDLFPHLYSRLPLNAVRTAAALSLDADGVAILPADLPA